MNFADVTRQKASGQGKEQDHTRVIALLKHACAQLHLSGMRNKVANTRDGYATTRLCHTGTSGFTMRTRNMMTGH